MMIIHHFLRIYFYCWPTCLVKLYQLTPSLIACLGRTLLTLRQEKKFNNIWKTWTYVTPGGCKTPVKREFSYYSAVFKTHSRIDYFLISASLLPNITNNVYDSIVLSDHAPTSLCYEIEQRNRHSTTWRLHPKWLQDSDFLKFIEEHVDLYFSLNTDQTTAAKDGMHLKRILEGKW